jgi:signal transduction histidine kinase
VNERSGNIYLFSTGERYVRAVRLVALAVIVGTAFIGRPHPSLRGNGLVILISLIVAGLTHVALTLASTGSPAMRAITVLAALSSGVVAGYEPSVGTAILLIFVGLSAGAGLEFGPGGLLTALAVVTTAISVLASDQGTGNVSLGAVAVVGFLAASGRKQYVLRAEEAELRLADAERAREEHARAAGLAERANAAREIHDILAHSLGALVLQLDALDAVLSAETPDHGRAAEILARARSLAVEGLNEARQAVGTLRADPPPLMDALRHLVDSTPGATLEITGSPGPIPAEVSVALRRSAQEGLANAVKHAPGAATTVHLDFTPDQVILTVTDTGCPDGHAPGPLAQSGGGYGIEGLRERAQLLGGTLVAGPQGAGWQVTLAVPEAHVPELNVPEAILPEANLPARGAP